MSPPRIRVIAAVFLAGFLVLVAWTARTRAPWCDEGWFASPAYNLAFRGFMGTTVLDPGSGTPVMNTYTRLDGIDKYTYWVMPLQLIAQAGWYKLLGFGLLRMRALSIAWALLALFCWRDVFGELSANRGVALLAAALVGLDNHFIMAATDGRMDMMCSALGIAGVAAYFRLREKHLDWAIFVANALIAASGLCHPNGVLYLIALICLVLTYDRSRIRFGHFAIAAFPYLVAAGAWLLYILKAPDLFWIQLSGNARGRTTLLAAPLRAINLEIGRYLKGFGFATWSSGFARLSVIELLVFVAAILLCAVWKPLRSQLSVRRTLIVTGAVFGYMLAFEGAKPSAYLFHIVPWFCLATAMASREIWRRLPAMHFLLAGALGLVMLIDLSRVAVPAIRDRYQKQYLPAAEYVRSNAQPRDLIMGPAEVAFVAGFDHDLVDDILLGTKTGKRARFIVVDERYRDHYESIRTTAPDDYRRVADRLDNEYDKVYDEANYQVYRLKL